MVTINELFSGIGAQVAGLKRLGIAYDVVGISEIDKFAIQSYEAINGSVRNYGDISKVPLLDYADLWTYSFPCQDLSVAGKQAGIKEGTRSGLLLEVERLLENAVLLGNQPKYLLLENVKALVSKKFKPDFDRWLNKLSELGYDNYWKVLNAKDFGIPQNRERVFVVSIRKDLNQTYMFPEPVPLTLKLKDLLEPEVDEKYYLPQEKVEQLALNLNKDVSNTGSLDGKHTWDVVIAVSRGRNLENPSSREAGLPTEQRMEVNSSGVSNTLTTVQKDNLVMYVGKALYPDKNYTGHNYAGATFDAEGLAPTLNTMNGGNHEPFVLQQPINTCADGSCQALTAHLHKETANDCTKFERHSPATGVLEQTDKIRIRKLTPRECWRLMGFTDVEFDVAQMSGVSNSQLYKQAGNSIVVDVLTAIFKELL